MIDHYPRIRAQQQQADELAAIEQLEQHVAPLIWLVYVAAFVAVFCIAVDGWKRYEDMVAYYTDVAAQNEALMQCINGQALRLGDAVLSCEVREYKLVAGVGS